MTAIPLPLVLAPVITDQRLHFFVLDGHTFGYVERHAPFTLRILQSKLTMGATHTWQDGSCQMPITGHGVREATAGDFLFFGINLRAYAKDSTRYAVPAF